MGEHKGKLKELEDILIKRHGKSQDKTLKNISKNLRKDWRPLTVDYINEIDGKKTYVDVIGNDDWRAIVGKVVCFASDAFNSGIQNFEIWVLTDFEAHKDIEKLTGEKKDKKIQERKDWYGILKDDIICKMLEKLDGKIFFKYYDNNSGVIL